MAEIRPGRAASLLLLFVVLAYANAVFLPFLYDDELLVVQNPLVRSLSFLPEMIGFHDGGFMPNTRWTRTVTHAVEYSAFGLWSPAYHATNIALHATNVLLVCLLVRRMLRDDTIAFCAAAVFAVHPIQTEAVTHVSGRRDLLAALFALSFLLVLLSWVRRGGFWRPPLAAVLFLLGVFSKLNAVMAAPAFALVHYWSSCSTDREEGSFVATATRLAWRHGRLYGSMAVVSAGLLFVHLFVAGDKLRFEGSPSQYELLGSFGPADRVGLAGWALRMFVAPLGQTIDYSYDALGTTIGTWAEARLIGIALVIALAAITVVGVRRRNPFGLAGLWFGVFWVPHFGFVPWHEVFAERFLYLPSVGLSIGAATAGVYVWRRCAREPRAVLWQPALAWTGLAVVVLLGAMTHQRNRVWQSGETLWSNAVQNHPTAAKSRKAMADYHMLRGRPDLALGHYREAVKLLPEYQDAHVGIGAALIEQRKILEAFAHLDGVIERWPDNARAHALAGLLHDSVGERDQAIAEFELAVAGNPQFGPAWVSLGTFYAEDGQMDRALEMFGRGATVESSKLDALKGIAAVHRFLGDSQTAAVYEARAREALGGS